MVSDILRDRCRRGLASVDHKKQRDTRNSGRGRHARSERVAFLLDFPSRPAALGVRERRKQEGNCVVEASLSISARIPRRRRALDEQRDPVEGASGGTGIQALAAVVRKRTK
jgi:hypothetical protein